MEKHFCRHPGCAYVVFAGDSHGAARAIQEHVETVHSSPVELHETLLGACHSFLLQFSEGVRCSKVEAGRLCARIAELSPGAVRKPQSIDAHPEILDTIPEEDRGETVEELSADGPAKDRPAPEPVKPEKKSGKKAKGK